MRKLDKHEKRIVTVVILLSLTAMVCRWLAPYAGDAASAVLGAVRVGVYIGIVTAWALSVKRRILSLQVKSYLLCSAALMVCWLLVRTVRYNLPSRFDALSRYCWYAYYIPMLLIPTLGIFAAVCINRAEEYTLPRRMRLLGLPALLMAGAVLANDLHQKAFAFPNGVLNSGADYTYGPVYFAAVLLIFAEAAAFIGLLWKKSRLPDKDGRLLAPLLPPLLPPLLGLLYTAAYILRLRLVRLLVGDITVMLCLIMVCTYEACIRARLIPSNARYDELFRASTIAARITDKSYSVLFASDADMSICADVMRQTEKAPVMLPGNIRLSGAPIAGGHVVWQEDMTELVAVLGELRDAKESLEESNDLIREENGLKAREARIAEQGRLYDMIQRDTRSQTELLVKLTEEFEQADSEEERKKLLGKMAVVGTYIKRRSNLILCGDKTPFLGKKDIELTFGESLDNLELYGVDCGLGINSRGSVAAKHIMLMYDVFEKVAERFDMSVLTVVIGGGGHEDSITLNTDSASDFYALKPEGVDVLRDEDGEWQLTVRLPRGGETL